MTGETLFELDDAAAWGYERRLFLDNEHRYTKMHRLLRERHGDLAGARILDLGCCRGQLLARFAAYPGVELGGLEIDRDEGRLARERGLEPVVHHINRFEGDRMVARLPWSDGSADVVLAGEIIEHVVDTEGFLREIRRVLRPAGSLVLSTPNVLFWKHRLQILAGHYPESLDYRLRYGDDFGHVRAFAPAPLRELLAETGFFDVAVLGKRLGPVSLLVRLPRPAAWALDRLADRMAGLADHLVVFARAG